MGKTPKTNAMRILERNNIDYKALSYEIKDDKLDGVSVAAKIGRQVKEVYKTLVSIGSSGEYYVFVIPVNLELDLKKAAKSVAEKSIEMIKVSDINKVTGYIRGGCSPIGMRKEYRTIVHSDGENMKSIIVSAGKIGFQIELDPRDLKKLIDCEFEDIVK